MAKQNYKNHIRYYLPHHLFFYAAVFILMLMGAIEYFHHHRIIWIFVVSLSFMIGSLSFMLRQHYALMCQDRIVRLEMRFRYYLLTGKNFEPIEKQISFKQLAALRFASDAELQNLIDRTLQEQLSPNDIKQSIVDWQADDMRV